MRIIWGINFDTFFWLLINVVINIICCSIDGLNDKS